VLRIGAVLLFLGLANPSSRRSVATHGARATPPATPVPPATSTIDPTLAAQFIIEPTSTRLPTFTPPPAITPHIYPEAVVSTAGYIPWAAIIISFTILGVFGFLLSLFRR